MQKFPLETLQKVRKYIQDTLVLPATEQQPLKGSAEDDLDNVPEPESLDALGALFGMGGGEDIEPEVTQNVDGWFISTINPATALVKLPGLSLNSNLRLVGYVYRSSTAGAGIIWALPEPLSTTAQLEQALKDATDCEHPPHPAGALPDVMAALLGDSSPASFVIASILRRELLEFGASASRRNWGHHRLIDAVPTQLTWHWQAEQPKSLSPKVQILPDGRAAVELFTCRTTPPFSLYRHLDQYATVGQYTMHSVERSIAVVQKKA